MKSLYELAGDVARAYMVRDETTRFQSEQNVDGIIAHCAHMQEQIPNTHGRAGVPMAEVPMVIYEQAVQEGWANDPAAWRKWLNDPANKCFRIWKGRA